jgi:hypothetical protein
MGLEACISPESCVRHYSNLEIPHYCPPGAFLWRLKPKPDIFHFGPRIFSREIHLEASNNKQSVGWLTPKRSLAGLLMFQQTSLFL